MHVNKTVDMLLLFEVWSLIIFFDAHWAKVLCSSRDSTSHYIITWICMRCVTLAQSYPITCSPHYSDICTADPYQGGILIQTNCCLGSQFTSIPCHYHSSKYSNRAVNFSNKTFVRQFTMKGLLLYISDIWKMVVMIKI